MSVTYDPGNGNFLVVDGKVVERDALHIAERIKEYDPNLEVLCLDPVQAEGFNDAPFLICEKLPNGNLSRVFEAWKLDHTVLERIYAADTARNNVLLDLEGKELLQRLESQKRYEEKRAENMDLIVSVARHRKSKFTFENREGDKVTLYDDRPAEKH